MFRQMSSANVDLNCVGGFTINSKNNVHISPASQRSRQSQIDLIESGKIALWPNKNRFDCFASNLRQKTGHATTPAYACPECQQKYLLRWIANINRHSYEFVLSLIELRDRFVNL